MSSSRKSLTLGPVVFFTVAFLLGTYFSFAATQGEYGLFRRIEVQAEADSLRLKHDDLQRELATIRNKTRRLSDDYLDLDLLDEQARTILGLIRADEIVIR